MDLSTTLLTNGSTEILCNNIVYESDYDISEVFNSYFSVIGVTFDEDLSTVDEIPLN